MGNSVWPSRKFKYTRNNIFNIWALFISRAHHILDTFWIFEFYVKELLWITASSFPWCVPRRFFYPIIRYPKKYPIFATSFPGRPDESNGGSTWRGARQHGSNGQSDDESTKHFGRRNESNSAASGRDGRPHGNASYSFIVFLNSLKATKRWFWSVVEYVLHRFKL